MASIIAWMEPAGFFSARAMSLMDSPDLHRFHSSFFLPASDNSPGRPGLATHAPPVRTTPKTLPCCTDRLNPLLLFLRDLFLLTEDLILTPQVSEFLSLLGGEPFALSLINL